jgi:excisionase family DNA binding protein
VVRLLSTGRAASLCGVTKDSVLKWIRKGKLRAERTVGGHFRIDPRDLRLLCSASLSPGCVGVTEPGDSSLSLHCWEYMSSSGILRAECKECVVYESGAMWCFRLVGKGEDVGHKRQFCGGSCQECSFYRRANGLPTNLLVVSSDEDLLERLTAEKIENLEVCCARTAYEASALTAHFPAAFAVLDEETTMALETGLARALASDPRLPGIKIILAVPPPSRHRAMHSTYEGIVAVLEKPLHLRQIASVIESFSVAHLEPKGA